jgi:hypothetical protein
LVVKSINNPSARVGLKVNTTAKGSFTVGEISFSVTEIVYPIAAMHSVYTVKQYRIASLTYKRNPRETNTFHFIVVTWLPSIEITSRTYRHVNEIIVCRSS